MGFISIFAQIFDDKAAFFYHQERRSKLHNSFNWINKLSLKERGQGNSEEGQDGFYMRALARRCVWRARQHRGANSSPDLGQAGSALQNSDSESIKGRIMRANYVVRPFAGLWQRYAKILPACMFLFDRLPKPIQMLPKPERRAGNAKVLIE